jgi:hypothetical protein
VKVVRLGLGWWWAEEGVHEAPIRCSVSAVNKWLFSALAIIFADDRNRGHRLVDELTREGRAAVTESGALDEGGGTMRRVRGLCCVAKGGEKRDGSVTISGACLDLGLAL